MIPYSRQLPEAGPYGQGSLVTPGRLDADTINRHRAAKLPRPAD